MKPKHNLIKAGILAASLLLCGTGSIAVETMRVHAAEIAESSADSSEITYLYTVEDLLTMADNPSGNYVLMRDIDMTGVNWIPFTFSGILDGNGHALLNLKVTAVGEETADTYDGNMKVYDTSLSGLFSILRDATVSNLTLLGLDVSIETDKPCFIGGITGLLENSSITDCTINGTLSLMAHDRMFGVGGIIGYGHGLIENTSADVTLICIDTDAATRDEQFLGGACAAGYPDINHCTVQIAGYDSDHGYVHNGGLIGMYMFYPAGKTYYGSMTHNKVTGRITFFEDNTNRRAYCKDFVGEIVSWDFLNGSNTSDFVRDERFEYDKNLLPHTCAEPTYTDVVTEPGCDSFGYTLHTCSLCGYESYDCYTLKQHKITDWTAVKEATIEEHGLEHGECELCDYTEDRETPLLPPPAETLQPSASASLSVDALSEEVQAKTGSKLPLLPILGISAILLFGLVIVVIKHKGRQ